MVEQHTSVAIHTARHIDRYTQGVARSQIGENLHDIIAERTAQPASEQAIDQNLALTNGAPSNSSELLALNIYRTFYGRAGFEGVGQAKAVVFFIIVAVIALIQNKLTTSKEVQA